MPGHHSLPRLSQLLERSRKEEDEERTGSDPRIPNVLSSIPPESLGQGVRLNEEPHGTWSLSLGRAPQVREVMHRTTVQCRAYTGQLLGENEGLIKPY